jgi:type I restriction enzyme M protein
MNLQELVQETLWKAASKIYKDRDNNGVGFRLYGGGLILLKYMSHAFDRFIQALKMSDSAHSDSEGELIDVSQYLAKNFLYIPCESRWEFVLKQVNQVGIGSLLDKAMQNIEQLNPSVRKILPREYASPNIRKDELALFIKKLGAIPKEYMRTDEILQGVYGYFMRNSPVSGDKNQKPLSTPACIDKLLVAMMAPVRGSIFNPCCGVGSMFVESHAFISQRQGSTSANRIVFYGQESAFTHFQLCRMNLAIHGINGLNVKCNNESSLDRDIYPDLKADYILCAPSFNNHNNKSNSNNSDFLWLQYIISHLAPKGMAGIVLSKDYLSMDVEKGDCAWRKPVEDQWVNCIVTLPDQLFPAKEMYPCLWILTREKGPRARNEEILFIDASSGIPGKSSTLRRLSTADIDEIARIYHHWKEKNGDYKDVKGFCKSVDWKTVKKQHFDLRPGRYV